MVEPKVVEEVFVRFGRVLHLHVGGQVIATSAEHPFYAYNRGWVPAGSLAEGDRLLGERGEWVPVEELFDTGDHATLYNLRIADWHTYFVGEESWGWAAWAHNRECRVDTEADSNGNPIHVLRDPDGKEIARGPDKDALIAQGKALDAERAAGKGSSDTTARIPRSITDNPEVKATFHHAGHGTFEDVNPTARNPAFRTGEAIPTGSTNGTRPYNNNTTDMHAEIGAMYQSYASGNRGGKGVLQIEGLHACMQCRGDIKRMARLMELDELTVITPEGSFSFRGPNDFLPIKHGGKNWQ